MDKITFLNYLEDELSRLPKTERDKIMYEYETKFFETQNEEELIHELDNPKAIAKKIYANTAIKDAEMAPNFKNVFHAIMATLGLSFFNILFVITPFLFITFLLLIVVLIGAIMILGPIVSVVNIFINGFHWIDITNILFAFSFLGLGLMLVITGLKLIEISYKGILKYLKRCIKIIKRSAE